MRPALLILTMLLFPAVCRADDIVQTLTARLAGPIRFAGDHLTVGGQQGQQGQQGQPEKTVPWSDVVLVALKPGDSDSGPSSAVRLAGGDLLAGDIQGLAGKTLTLQTALLGTLKLDIANLASLEFVGRPADKASDKNTLYRVAEEPIPGSLIWIDPKKLSIDTPLGAVTVSRAKLARYVFDPAVRAGAGAADDGTADSLTLTDFTQLRGPLTFTAQGVGLKHPLLGNVKLPYSALRTVRLRRAGIVALTSLKPAKVDATPLIAAGPTPGLVELAACGAEPFTCTQGLSLEPGLSVSFDLSRLDNSSGSGQPGSRQPGSGRLVAWLCGQRLAQSDAHVKIVSGGQVAFEQTVAAAGAAAAAAGRQAAIPLDVELAGRDLTIEVTFAKTVRFPCGVVLADPLLLPGKPKPVPAAPAVEPATKPDGAQFRN